AVLDRLRVEEQVAIVEANDLAAFEEAVEDMERDARRFSSGRGDHVIGIGRRRRYVDHQTAYSDNRCGYAAPTASYFFASARWISSNRSAGLMALVASRRA